MPDMGQLQVDVMSLNRRWLGHLQAFSRHDIGVTVQRFRVPTHFAERIATSPVADIERLSRNRELLFRSRPGLALAAAVEAAFKPAAVKTNAPHQMSLRVEDEMSRLDRGLAKLVRSYLGLVRETGRQDRVMSARTFGLSPELCAKVVGASFDQLDALASSKGLVFVPRSAVALDLVLGSIRSPDISTAQVELIRVASLLSCSSHRDEVLV